MVKHEAGEADEGEARRPGHGPPVHVGIKAIDPRNPEWCQEADDNDEPKQDAHVPLAFWHLTYSLRRCQKISATLVQTSHAPGHHTTPGSRLSTMGTKITGLLPMTTPLMTARQKSTRSFRSHADI